MKSRLPFSKFQDRITVFLAMFSHQMRESLSNTIELPETVNAEYFSSFLELLLPPKCMKIRDELNEENILHLLEFSHQYQVQALFEECALFLRKIPPQNITIEHLNVAMRYGVGGGLDGFYLEIVNRLNVADADKANEKQILCKLGEGYCSQAINRNKEIEAEKEKIKREIQKLVKLCECSYESTNNFKAEFYKQMFK